MLLWAGSNANTMCPGAMTDAAARLLQANLLKPNLDPALRPVIQNAYDHVISRDPSYAWTSGQWMTERSGGSDVSQTETIATFSPAHPAALASTKEHIPCGPFSISGFKFFSSATDACMTILLARTTPDKGVSAFFAPMRRAGGETNGVRIQRLKDKLGTKPVPTAELELSGMRGWMIGEEGKGIQEIATMLNVTRVHCASGSLGSLGRGLAIARAYALVREVGAGKGVRVPLCQSNLHMRTLAELTGEYHGMSTCSLTQETYHHARAYLTDSQTATVLLFFFTVYILGLDESRSNGRGTRPPSSPTIKTLTPPERHVAPLLRVLSSLHKGYICKQSVPAIYACVEALGGVGYLNNAESEALNVSRLFRDACVNAIWEGTTDVVAADFLRAIKHPTSGAASVEALEWFVASTLGDKDKAGAGVLAAFERLFARIKGDTVASLLPEARHIMFELAEIVIAALLVVDAKRDSSEEAELIRRRFFAKKGYSDEAGLLGVATSLELDSAIVYGRQELQGQRQPSKL
jgi:alkylation response protein AidB-like acyl-CoA dehydrogenase